MSTPDLSPLIKGVLTLVLFSMAIGQYPALERWARKEALAAVTWREPLPYFFGESGNGFARSRSTEFTKISTKPARLKAGKLVR